MEPYQHFPDIVFRQAVPNMEEEVLQMEVYAELDRRWEQSYGGQIAVLGSSELEVINSHTGLPRSMRLG